MSRENICPSADGRFVFWHPAPLNRAWVLRRAGFWVVVRFLRLRRRSAEAKQANAGCVCRSVRAKQPAQALALIPLDSACLGGLSLTRSQGVPGGPRQ